MGGLLAIKKRKENKLKLGRTTHTSPVQFRAIENHIVIETKIYLLAFDSRRVKVKSR